MGFGVFSCGDGDVRARDGSLGQHGSVTEASAPPSSRKPWCRALFLSHSVQAVFVPEHSTLTIKCERTTPFLSCVRVLALSRVRFVDSSH